MAGARRRSGKTSKVLKRIASVGAIAVLLTMIAGTVCLAAGPWTPNGVIICDHPQLQNEQTIIPDGNGGAIITWIDQWIGFNEIYTQKVDANGVRQWPTLETPMGIKVCDVGGPTGPQIASDGSGGAFITWNGRRTGNDDIYVQKVSSSGQLMFATNGIPVCDAPGNQISPSIIPVTGESAIIEWNDWQSGSGDIYAQKIDKYGARQWETPGVPGDFNGVPICTASGYQQYSGITSDGANGAVISWCDRRSGSGDDVYAQRVSTNGTPLWTVDGVYVTALPSSRVYQQIISDGAQGAIIAWPDSNWHINAQRLLGSDGSPMWGPVGVEVCNPDHGTEYHRMIPDSSSGAIITWKDLRAGNNGDIYAQKVNSSGTPQWQANGVAIAVGANKQENPEILTDGSGGAIIAWEDNRVATQYDILARQVLSSGSLGSNVQICNAAKDQIDPQMAPDNANGAIVTWTDFRPDPGNFTNSDIYAQKFVNNHCGAGSANALVLFGVMMGFLSIAGTGGLIKKRWRGAR